MNRREMAVTKSEAVTKSAVKTKAKQIAAAIAAALLCATSMNSSSNAQNYPAKPVRIVVAVAPGGLQDQLARGLAQDLGRIWNQSVIVENRPGAGGIAAAESVKSSGADGHSILQMDNNAYLTNFFLRPKLPYDLERDFTPVIVLVFAKNILVTSTAITARNILDVFALARQKPGALNYGSFGIGAINHIDTEALATLAGVSFTHVPYKGGAPLLQAIMTNEVQFALAGMTAAIPLIRQNRIRAIGYGGLTRSPLFPDVPTLAESGLAGFESAAWFGWAVPLGTSRDIVDKIHADTAKVMTVPEFRDKFILGAGHEPGGIHGSKVPEMLTAEKVTFGNRIKPLNLKLE
ncbi:MAG: Bug family tripartite tricarboxylate transporter substrate binding protein [Burkholderiales bacterium]